jgi:hypothetical protein
MNPKFYLNRFLCILIGLHLVVYLCWAFISLSLLEPIIKTFSTADSRGFYLAFLFCSSFISAPYYAPFEEDVKTIN